VAPLPTVLVLGDGDFAFSARLAAAGTHAVTATTIETEDEVVARYPMTFPSHRRAILQHGGVCVFSVDATRLEGRLLTHAGMERRFTRVVFNNPYTAGVEKGTHRAHKAAKTHQKLVRDFIVGVHHVLCDGPDSRVVVSLNPSPLATVGASILLRAAALAGLHLLREYPFSEGGRTHQYVLRFGDARDLDRGGEVRRKTYAKRGIRTYEFGVGSGLTAELEGWHGGVDDGETEGEMAGGGRRREAEENPGDSEP